MTKHYQEQLIRVLQSLKEAHIALNQAIQNGTNEQACAILEECQNSAITVGNAIEETEGEGTKAVGRLEVYCEQIYLVHTAVQTGEKASAIEAVSQLTVEIDEVCMAIEAIIPRREVVFCPYKAAMWDSLESIWMAFAADESCDTYVIPIPYYEKESDGSFGKMHYERSLFPEEVPTISFEAYDYVNRRPDAIYVHNPYDGANHVTSIHPSFYSSELSQYTEALFYVPYYVVSGDVSDFGMHNPVNYHADYIVMQAARNREGYPAELPDEKFLPLGSPKLDKVIRLCNNPPEIPDAWKAQMEGKKVYFYNTSIGGMLADTRKFLLKMEYVFRCFQGRHDACLLWRPHPLLESTFDSMRADYKPFFDELKRVYVREQIGILDTTPDIERTIALSDAYVGDTGTSVTALFGIAGKPIFALNNQIHEETDCQKKQGEKATFLAQQEAGRWLITVQNQLYERQEDGAYHFMQKLSEYASGAYYQKVIAVGDKLFVCPRNAMDVLIMDAKNGEIVKKLAMAHPIHKGGAFADAVYAAPYIFLIPLNYEAIVRIDTRTYEMQYVTGCNHVFVDMVGDELRAGGTCIWGEYLLLASPINNQVLALHRETLAVQLLSTGADESIGCHVMTACADEIYLMPMFGTKICAWNPDTGAIRTYEQMPETLNCIQMRHGYQCMERPFANGVRIGKMLYLAPYWANQFVALDLESGQCKRMGISDVIACREVSGYFYAEQIGAFVGNQIAEDGIACFVSDVEKACYMIDLEKDTCRKKDIIFDEQDLAAHEPGFDNLSQWMLYGCEENAQNTLKDFLDGTITGATFDNEKQLEAFGYIAENSDGSCGQKVYEFTKKLWDGSKA